MHHEIHLDGSGCRLVTGVNPQDGRPAGSLDAGHRAVEDVYSLVTAMRQQAPDKRLVKARQRRAAAQHHNLGSRLPR